MQLLDYYRSRFGQAVKRQGNGWNGPCPLCGGAPGKSDRFMIWPDRSESLGELCAKNQIKGIWACRQCGKSGDTIAYLTKCEGMTFKDAFAELGIEGSQPIFRRRKAPEDPPPAATWIPKDNVLASKRWQEQAEKLLCSAEKTIWNTPAALSWLEARGIKEEAIRKYRIGYLTAESVKYQGRFRPRQAFGLPAKIDQDGKRHDKIFIPRGILIPTFSAQGAVINLRIRRHKEDLVGRSPKYLELEGSYKGPMFLESTQPRQLAVYFIMEAELDAILIHHASGGVVGAVAVRTNRGKPDSLCHPYLQAAVRICVALDYDEAGAQGCGFWETTYPNSCRWPTPDGKDPGDAYALGVNIREWIAASLPGCVALEEEPVANSGIISQISEEIQANSEFGHEDTSAFGLSNLGSGETPEDTKMEKGNGPSIRRARIHARAMAENWTTEVSRWDKTAPVEWASEEDFTRDELAFLKKALPADTPLEDMYLDVAVIWLLWRNAPIAFVSKLDEKGNCQGFSWKYDRKWERENRERFDLFFRYQSTSRDFWHYISDFPAEKITSHNLLHIWRLLREKQEKEEMI